MAINSRVSWIDLTGNEHCQTTEVAQTVTPSTVRCPYIPTTNVVKSEIRTGKAMWLPQWPCDPNDQN